MIALQINNVKSFMSRLLASEAFDHFLLAEASVTTYNTFFIDGRQNQEFYSEEEWNDTSLRPYEFSCWKDMRSLIFNLIKGKHVPVSFKFVLHLIPEKAQEMLSHSGVTVPFSEIKALVLNIKYDSTGLCIISGTSLRTFLPDKSADLFWDRHTKTFLTQVGIDYEEK